MWSFVGNKKRQRWLWYAWEPRLKRIIAHVFGSRSKKTLCKLLKLLSGFSVAFWCTDGYRAYNEKLPKAKHIVGKLYTQRIERENLTLRNRLKRLNRKTLGYSKLAEMHDRIIGTFIEREHYVWWSINTLNTWPKIRQEFISTQLGEGSRAKKHRSCLLYWRSRESVGTGRRYLIYYPRPAKIWWWYLLVKSILWLLYFGVWASSQTVV